MHIRRHRHGAVGQLGPAVDPDKRLPSEEPLIALVSGAFPGRAPSCDSWSNWGC